MDSIVHEFRHAFRQLLRAPRFSLPAILVLALGIAANGALLSLSEALLRKPLNVPRPHELVALVTSNKVTQDYYSSISFPDFFDYRDRNSVLVGLAGYSPEKFTFRAAGEAETVSGQAVSDNYFSVLEVGAARGRFFEPRAADTSGVLFEAVLSFGFWQRRFGGDPDVVGEIVYVDRRPFTVVGIAGQGFYGVAAPAPADLWISFDSYAATRPQLERIMSNRGAHWMDCLGRLRPGVDLNSAEREMVAIAAQLAQDHPDSNAEWSVVLQPAAHGVSDPAERKEVIRILGIFGAATGLLLLIICTSVMSLLLAQAMARGREIAVRLALGAPRRFLLRGFTTEYVLLALLGGGVGLFMARGLLSVLSAFRPGEFLPVAQSFEFQVSPSVAVALLFLALLAGAISGVVPASYMFTVDLRSELVSKATVGTPKGGTKRLGSVFVMGQVGLSTVLLIGAGLAFASWRGLSAVDLGFEPRGVALLPLDLASGGYDEDSGSELYRSFRKRLENRSAVESVSLAHVVPFGSRRLMRQLAVERQESGAERATINVTGNVVSPDYFRTMGIALLRGRDFDRHDAKRARGVAIVNETWARKIWPGEEVVGKTFRFVNRDGYGPPLQIVGVARDSWHLKGRRGRHGPHFYLPLDQHFQPAMKVLVKTGLPVAEVREMAAEELRRLDPDLVASAAALPDLVAASLARERTALALLGATSLLALVLAGFGLYSTLSYLVGRRRAEIGLRMALGARPGDILSMVIGRGLVPTALGLGLGLLIATRASRLLGDLLYEVRAVEPSVYLGVALLVLSLSVLAAFLPARRAARIHPAESLAQGS